ncbi:uncharacterized protein [Centruroides vittatus]|uniref:uncharacterized protein n=1 Tax=Centruroides vittatus TaxID=120091 RepID=UPI00350FE64F
MTISFDTLIIIIVVVSASIVIGVIVALCWMWRILRHDRDCVTLQNPYSWSVVPRWPADTCTPAAASHVTDTPCDTAPLTNDTAAARVIPARRDSSYRVATAPPWEEVISRHMPGSEVLVIDGTEPPPPYAV